jgi:hypothetical protein
MVGMLVGDQDRVDGVEVFVDRFETLTQLQDT